jgi:hypothetical protein
MSKGHEYRRDRQAFIRGEQRVKVASTIGELSGLPIGTRIATNHNKLLLLGEFAGSEHWYEEGELTNYQPMVHWLPAYILPAPVDPKADIPMHEAETVVKTLLGHPPEERSDWCEDRCWLTKDREDQ